MPVSVWTSTLQRTIQTAEQLPFPKLRWKASPGRNMNDQVQTSGPQPVNTCSMSQACIGLAATLSTPFRTVTHPRMLWADTYAARTLRRCWTRSRRACLTA
jgi:hypothetical protein